MGELTHTIDSIDRPGWTHHVGADDSVHRFERDDDTGHYIEATLLQGKYVVQLRNDFDDWPSHTPGPLDVPRSNIEPGNVKVEILDLMDKSHNLAE